jgi:phenylalanyl-tRNA synthetase beta chain
MRVPWEWLRDQCDPGMEPEALAERLAMTGTEVERVTLAGPPAADGFVVGEVLSVTPHPNADRLSLCQVRTGDGERTIVCGAANVAAGQSVAVALPGAVLPDGNEIARAELRGVASDGMILSEAELGLGDDAEGILVLDGAPAPGASLGEVLPVAEPVLELEVTPNRVDCLGVRGVAREVHAATGAELAPDPWAEDADASGEGEVADYASVEVEVPELCPRFTARVFTDVTIGPSPLWLRARLAAAGQRSINNVVDITNYVMLLTAQPLHAFDLDGVPDGALVIRTAADGEKMTTLDGVERSFDADTVLVCDREGPSGIAGIMGGQRSEVSGSTTRVLLEVANWDGVNILRTSKLLALRSEASTRFEKQLHPELAMRAQRVASRLMVELCGALLVPGTVDVTAEIPPPNRLRLRTARVEGLLGMPIPPERSATYLERLGFSVEPAGDDLEVEVPVDRHFDVTREADLIEEVARIHGLDENLPTTMPDTAGQVGGLTREQQLRRRAEDLMGDLGFDEIVGWSFSDEGLAGRLRLPEADPRANAIRLANPLSGEQSLMRTTLIGSLLDAARHNLARGAEAVALFESGRVYLSGPPGGAAGELGGVFPGEQPPPALERHHLGCLASGAPAAEAWRGDGRPADFFALKGALEALARGLGAPLEVEPSSEPFLHPGRSARLLLGGAPAGWLGELHPLVLRRWDIDAATGFEIGLAELVGAAASGHEQFRDVVSFPAVYQDIAAVVPEDVPASSVREAVLSGGGELLAAADIFDLYRGEQVGEGRKSLALRLEFRAPDRTLTDDEVAERREAIRSALAGLGGSLRE